MEFIQFEKSECPVCMDEDITIICPFCHEKACKKCIMDYNMINDTKKCLCPSCKTKFNKLVSYMIFGGESKFFLQSQMKKYRDIVMVNSSCVEFYKTLSKINKLQLEKLMDIPNYQLLLSYYISILKNKKTITTDSMINTYFNKIFIAENIEIMKNTPSKKQKYFKIIETANNAILKESSPKKWVCVDERNAYGPECYYIKRNPKIFEHIISETEKQQIVEEIEPLCQPRKRYLDDRFNRKKNVEFNNNVYGCGHCDTFVLEDDTLDSKNSEFNKKDILMGDDISKFVFIGEEPVSPGDKKRNSFNGGYIVKRKVKTFKLTNEYDLRIMPPHAILYQSVKYKYYMYICERIVGLYKPKNKARKMKFLNDLETFRVLLNICLIGSSPEQKELCDVIMLNIQKLIQTNNFNEQLIDLLKENLLINSGDDKKILDVHNLIKESIYGKDIDQSKIAELDDILMSSSSEDNEFNVEVLNDKKDVTYEDIFGEINTKYSLSSNVDKLSFQKCKKCNGYIVMNDKKERRCIKCNTRYCTECSEIFEGDEHVCDPDVIETIKLITQECHKCPCCGVPIFKISGCNHMFCTNCHNGFDWHTGNVLSENEQTNPLYFEWVNSQNNNKTTNGDTEGTDNEKCITPFEINPYRWAKFQFETFSNTFSEKIKYHQNIFAQNLEKVMENDGEAMKLLHNINKNKCLLGFTKYSFDELKTILSNLFTEDNNADKQMISNVIKKYFDAFQQQCSLFNTLFILGINGDEHINDSLTRFELDYKMLYDEIINSMKKLKLLNESLSDCVNLLLTQSESDTAIKDDILACIYENENYSVIGSKNFLARFEKCLNVMLSSYPKVLTFEEVLKLL